MKILIIGGGNMGATYARAFVRTRIVAKADMLLLEKSAEKAELLRAEDIGTVFSEPEECLSQADLIIIAVKPQDAKVLFARMAVMADPRQLYLSIMAGVRMDSIEDALGVGKIVRAMPNLPAQIGMGMSAFTCTPLVTRVELAMVQNLLNATGKTLYVENEDMLDAVTAISGSGPAYVFYMMDALIASAKNMGFSAAEAEMLVATTFAGATELFVQSGLSCQEWIGRVASKGGTTEAALAAFSAGQMGEKLMQGAEAARLRGVELGKA